MQTEIAVLGGGPGGYAAAFLAADLGMKVTIVEAEPSLGGVCLLRGCIPSKALLHVAKLIHESQDLDQWGLSFEPPKIDLDGVRDKKNKVIGNLKGGLKQLAKQRNVTVIQARGTFENSTTLKLSQVEGGPELEDDTLTFEYGIIASGSSPTKIPAFDLPTPRVMDSTGALELPEIPGSLLVVGGGYIGLEMGTVYSALGTDVSVVELTDGLLPGADRDLVKPLEKKLSKQMKNIYLNTKVVGMEDKGSSIEVTFEGDLDEKVQSFDYVLVSVGRRPNSKNLGLENTKVVVSDKGFIEVDQQQRTDDPNLFAIGDVAGEPMLAHKASHEGKVAVEVIHGDPAIFAPRAIPAVVFTDPEIAWAGLTEREAKEKNREVEVSKFPWVASGRAQAVDATSGMTKWIIDPKSEQLLGAGIVGSGAGELIAEAVLAIEMGATVRDLAESIHPHPTLSETVAWASEVFLGTATEIKKPAKKK
ncbi:Dihydrolipoyl dehydrogenase [Planctomycetales bacterium 10988]|nr:Dihydrolipoyl dehydrogenase [Planctomycetales bacterium 10988]